MFTPDIKPVIIYRYDKSPFSLKVDNVLLLKGIPHQTVHVSPTLPRPEITDYLGIIYRRIPILAIGNDIYCDTSLIVTVLERRFPVTNGYGTVFPPRKQGGLVDATLMKVFASHVESVVFSLTASLLPWDKLPDSFVKDRSAFIGVPIDPKAMTERLPLAQTALSSHMLLIEQQLRDSREWLFDTCSPSLADISLHFVLDFVKSWSGQSSILNAKDYSFTTKWFSRMSTFIMQKRVSQQAPQRLDGLDAASTIVSSGHESSDVVGFDVTESSLLRLKKGSMVKVSPADFGRNYPTIGKLVGLDREEVVLEVQGSQGCVRCHFPRLGFIIKNISSSKL